MSNGKIPTTMTELNRLKAEQERRQSAVRPVMVIAQSVGGGGGGGSGGGGSFPVPLAESTLAAIVGGSDGTIADSLNRLELCRRDLAANLTDKGVTALPTETLTVLVPKVLDIPAGVTPPAVGFVPTEVNAEGRISRGRWYGKEISDYSFYNYASLVALEHNEVTKIGSSAFYGCTSLADAIFPLVTSIGSNAFSGCSNISEVAFPLITSLGGQVFYHCASITKLDFPLVVSLGTSAFFACSSLSALILRSPTLCTLSGYNVFSNTPMTTGTGYIYVPAALVSGYKSATNWSFYANQIRAIEDYPEITGG